MNMQDTKYLINKYEETGTVPEGPLGEAVRFCADWLRYDTPGDSQPVLASDLNQFLEALFSLLAAKEGWQDGVFVAPLVPKDQN